MPYSDPCKYNLYRFLDDNGDGTGVQQAIGDYSVTPKTLFIQPPLRSIYRINMMLINIEAANIRWDRYGGIQAAPLINGVNVYVSDDDGILNDLTDQMPVTTNVGWGNNSFDIQLKTASAGDDFLQARWWFTQLKNPLQLLGNTRQRLEVVLNDDFTGLTSHCFKIEGSIQ